MNILVTGAAGFIGSHLCEALLLLGYRLTALDDLSNSDASNFAGISNPNFHFVHGSVADVALITKLFSEQSFDLVFHLAALNLLRSVADPLEDLKTNAHGTLVLLRALQKQNASGARGRMVFSSTGSVYGEPEYSPQDESHPLKPVSPYGISKLAAEHYVLLWMREFKVPTIALRYYNVYGPRQSFHDTGGVVGIFLNRALKKQPLIIEGDGNQERCFTFVSDVVRANLLAAQASEDKWGQAYNVGSTEITTVKDLALLVQRSCGTDMALEFTKPRIGDVRSFRPNIEKARLKLNYIPETKLADGLRHTADWLKTLQP